MNNTLTKILVVTAGVAFTAVATACTSSPAPATNPNEELRSTTAPQTVYLEPSWAFDIYDQRRVVGAADSVFVGTVNQVIGTVNRTAMPETQFSVTVLSVIKGDLAGDVVVNQQGGYDPVSDQAIYTEGDTPLNIGQSYIFSTVLDTAISAENFIPIVGAVPVDTADVVNLDPELAQRGGVAAGLPEEVQEAVSAVENEIPFDPNNTGLGDGSEAELPEGPDLPPQVDGEPVR
ncbi:hypothetical protein HQ312_12455 [Rhodococcus sp. BP-316]|uniref:hypothetical protein n=1 Tax=Rhodococcus sp. BP-316 TaxID=2739445 RepID=UPI001C9B3CC9|nr:hypothetical protein [Rhodococcus sp. BP-316]MBY6681865.1 hypothetical protein [Rhodococcus sp. BP-316]